MCDMLKILLNCSGSGIREGHGTMKRSEEGDLRAIHAALVELNPWVRAGTAVDDGPLAWPGLGVIADDELAAARRAAAVARAALGMALWNQWAAAMTALRPHAEASPAMSRIWTSLATIDFTQMTFDQSCDYAGFLFPGRARFAGVRFRHDAWFNAAHFADFADFSEATFEGDGYFERGRFDGPVSFFGARFKRSAQFRKTSFNGSAIFEACRFAKDAWFRGSTFAGTLSFARARFAGEAGLGDCRYGGPSDFTAMRFGDNAGFDTAHFCGPVRFDDTRFEGKAWFSQARFDAKASFDRAKFVAAIDFTDITCAEKPAVVEAIAELERRMSAR
jgi:hypothetical protein